MTAKGYKIAWEEKPVGRTFKSFWTTIKCFAGKSVIKRLFITGISPLSLSSAGSGFNVARNLSFDKDLAELYNLTHSNLVNALKKICKSYRIH